MVHQDAWMERKDMHEASPWILCQKWVGLPNLYPAPYYQQLHFYVKQPNMRYWHLPLYSKALTLD